MSWTAERFGDEWDVWRQVTGSFEAKTSQATVLITIDVLTSVLVADFDGEIKGIQFEYPEQFILAQH